MEFNSKKFAWVRYTVNEESSPPYQYLAPDHSDIDKMDNLRDLGVRLSSNLTCSFR